MVAQHHPQGWNQGSVVLQRLAHAHHHHIRDHTGGLPEVFAQKMLRKPQLGHNFCGAEIAAETLVPSRTKPAAHRATSLRRDTQSAPVGFGDKHGLYGITATHIKKPFDRAVHRCMLGHQRRCRDVGRYGQLVPQRLGQIRHSRKISLSALVNPAEKLGGAKRLFAHTCTKSGQALDVEVEQIGLHAAT